MEEIQQIQQIEEALVTLDIAREEVNDAEAADGQNDHIPLPETATDPECGGAAVPKTSVKFDKSTESVLKALRDLKTPEEKLAALCKKYVEVTQENKRLEKYIRTCHKSMERLQKEKDQLQSEHSKAILAKSKLESLCRELQKQNKMIRDEFQQRARQEEEKQQEISMKFQGAVTKINEQMEQVLERNKKLAEENNEWKSKFKELWQMFEDQEKKWKEIVGHQDAEMKLVEAKLKQSELLLEETREVHKEEMKHIMQEKKLLENEVECLVRNQDQLKAQLNLYVEKYEVFQATLNKSNEAFASFKADMDRMTKEIKKNDKEISTWKKRYEASQEKYGEVVAENERLYKDKGSLTAKFQRLEGLCRALQEERKNLLKQLQTTNSRCSSSNSNGDSKEGKPKSPLHSPSEVSSRRSSLSNCSSPDGEIQAAFANSANPDPILPVNNVDATVDPTADPSVETSTTPNAEPNAAPSGDLNGDPSVEPSIDPSVASNGVDANDANEVSSS